MKRDGRRRALLSASSPRAPLKSRGVVRTIVLMWRLRLMYFLGARPEALARLYANEP